VWVPSDKALRSAVFLCGLFALAVSQYVIWTFAFPQKLISLWSGQGMKVILRLLLCTYFASAALGSIASSQTHGRFLRLVQAYFSVILICFPLAFSFIYTEWGALWGWVGGDARYLPVAVAALGGVQLAAQIRILVA